MLNGTFSLVSYRCLSAVDSAISAGTDQKVQWYSKMAEFTFPTCPKHDLIEHDIMTLQAMEERYILAHSVARVAQYVVFVFLLINGTCVSS